MTQRCEQITNATSHRCRRAAMPGFNLCSQHGLTRKYYIQFSWQETSGDHWSKKKKAVWPLLFDTRKEAQSHLDSVSPFKNMIPRRKLIACVEHTKRTFPQPHLRKV